MKDTVCVLKSGSFSKEISRSEALLILKEHRRHERFMRSGGFKERYARRLVPRFFALGAFDLLTR